MKTFFQSHISDLDQKKKKILSFLITILVYVQGALQKKQLQRLSQSTLKKIKKIQHGNKNILS